MIINHNISAINAWRNTGLQNNALDKSLEKLSSGLRINRSADDAAGLSISEKMRNQIAGLNQATRNAQDAVSLIQTAEGALNETHAILLRMRELAIQARSDTNTNEDRAQTQKEVVELINEINRIASTTQFNTRNLLQGSCGTGANGSCLVFQIGANVGQTMSLVIGSMTADSSALNVSAVSVGGAASASAAISLIDGAISQVSAQRADLGAVQNRLEHTIANLGVAAENLQAAESRIRDVDMAMEMAKFTKTQILVQAGTAMMAQANMKPQNVLKLLG